MKRILLAAALLAGTQAPAFSGGLEQLAEAARAASPAGPGIPPVPAAAARCRPFLVSAETGGVDEAIVIERACSAQNEAYWVMTVERRSAAGIAARVSSADHPSVRPRLEKSIKTAALNGVTDRDADIIVLEVGPLLKAAAQAAPQERAALLAAAARRLLAHLAGN